MKKIYTILLVDDEQHLMNLPLVMLLEAKGFHCITKTDMTAAWEYIENNEVDVIVTDIMMPSGPKFPGIDSAETGFYFISKIRNEKPDISIICLSVIGDQSKIKLLKKQGVLYIRKGETPLDTAAKLIESKATGIVSY